MFRVLVTDSIAAEGLDLLKSKFDVDIKRGLSEPELIKTMTNQDTELFINVGTQKPTPI